MKLRLFGINAPELSTPEGKLARDFLISLFNAHPGPVTLRTDKDRKEKYGRYLATILLSDDRVVNEILLAEGHAAIYP